MFRVANLNFQYVKIDYKLIYGSCIITFLKPEYITDVQEALEEKMCTSRRYRRQFHETKKKKKKREKRTDVYQLIYMYIPSSSNLYASFSLLFLHS